MQIALTQQGQAALWVTNGCTSMSKPITILSTPMGVDNEVLCVYVSRVMGHFEHMSYGTLNFNRQILK